MKLFKNSVVLMTALVPTIGHRALIEFASEVTSGRVFVIVSTRDIEPVPGYQRINALENAFSNYSNVYILSHSDNHAPQNPNPDLEYDRSFWNYWEDVIYDLTLMQWDTPKAAVIASEDYGATLAKHLGCEFFPFDVDRSMYNISGTSVRKAIHHPSTWNKILPEFLAYLKFNVVMFGQESVGKTSTARKLQSIGKFIPEYARGYLERPSIGTEVTEAKMNNIALGQIALQSMSQYVPQGRVNVLDTDILSTIGYCRIMGYPKLEKDLTLLYQNHYHKNMFYVLLRDDIPFEPDPLRYGGDVRESTLEFWEDLLKEFNCEYVVIPKNLSLINRVRWIEEEIQNRIHKRDLPIINFERE